MVNKVTFVGFKGAPLVPGLSPVAF